MSTNRIIGLALMVLGLVLLIMGYNATQAPMEELSETFTGRYSDETVMYLIGGGIALVAGAAMAFYKR